MANEKLRMRILEKVELGEMNADDAIQRLVKEQSEMGDPRSTPMEVLGNLEAGIISPEEAAEPLGTPKRIQVAKLKSKGISEDTSDLPARNDRRGETLLWAGLGLVLLGTVWMESRLQNAGYDFWFFAAWLPLALGVVLIILARASRNSLWLSIYLNNKNGIGLKRLNLHFPLPSHFLRWSIKLFENEISAKDLNMLQGILAFEGPLKEPLIIHVNDEVEGTEVKAIIA